MKLAVSVAEVMKTPTILLPQLHVATLLRRQRAISKMTVAGEGGRMSARMR